MNELLLALWAMTDSHAQWPLPAPPEPPAIVRSSEQKGEFRSPANRRELRRALDRASRCSAGRLFADPETGLYVLELKKTGR